MALIAGERILAAVVSSNRPQNVARMEAMCDWPDPLLWVIPAEQESDYRFQGAKAVFLIHDKKSPNICGSRNLLLNAVWPTNSELIEGVVMLDDDTKQFRYAYEHEGTHARTMRVGLQFVVQHLLSAMRKEPDFRLGGIGPTANWLFVSGGERIKTRTFIQSNFVLLKPTTLRYDENLELSEDYDYCIQHIRHYGGIVRDDLILGDYQKRSNQGGLQALEDREAQDIESRKRLFCKWPQYVRWPHPKLGDREVTVNWKAIA